MTPTTVAPPARSKQTKPRATRPKAPRRVSGPLRGVSRTRPVSIPSRRAPAAAPRPRRVAAGAAHGSLGARSVAFVRALPDHRLLDRIVRGRAWIPILGVLLAGIVAMQVEVLKLGASMGRSIQRTTALQSQNELLRASVARLADDQRIESLAVGMGMVMPAPEAIGFLSLRPRGYVQRAAASIHAPNAASFIASLPATATPAGPATTAVSSPSTSGAPPATPSGASFTATSNGG